MTFHYRAKTVIKESENVQIGFFDDAIYYVCDNCTFVNRCNELGKRDCNNYFPINNDLEYRGELIEIERI